MIRGMMRRSEEPPAVERQPEAYSLDPPPGDSDFLRAIDGCDLDGVWKILDDLMDTLRVVTTLALCEK